MLQTQTVEPGTFSLLKELCDIAELRSFALVGGTALSLKFGHRTSVDLDFFSIKKFNPEELESLLSQKYVQAYAAEEGHRKWGLFCLINNVKTDLVHYPHPLIEPIIEINGIRMYSDADIAAMKIQAILGRARKKDFYDLYELLQHYDLQQIINWHKQKYPNQMLAISIPNAITYFAEANADANPNSMLDLSWQDVKEGIAKAVRDFLA